MSDLRNLFKQEHGHPVGSSHEGYIHINSAQAILNSALDKAVRVYGFADKHGWYKPDTESNHNATHSAVLFDIQEFKKECEHMPHIIRLPNGDSSDTWTNRTCKHCGIKLKATWSPA